MKTTRLGDHVAFLSGFAFKSKHFNTDGIGLPLVRIRDVVSGMSETFYSGDYDDRYVVQSGDCLIGMDGEFNLGYWQSGKALLNQRVCKVGDVSPEIDRGYLARFLALALKRIEEVTPFVTVKHLSVKTLSDARIPLPSLPEQKRIAAALDAVDTLRTKRRESIEQLDSLVQAMFLKMFGDPVTNPKGWDVVKSARLFSEKPKIGTTKKADGKGYLVVRVGEIGNAQIQFSDCSRVELKKAELDRYVLQRGDTVIARAIGSKAQLGKASFFDGFSEDVVVDSHVMRLRPDSTVCDSKWFYTLISSTRGKILLQSKGGATAVQFNINAKQVSDIDIPLPPVGLQTRFAAIVDSIEQQKAQLKAHLGELDTLFASLQFRAFKGPPNP